MAKEEKEKKVKEVKETKEVEVKEEHECKCGDGCNCKKSNGFIKVILGIILAFVLFCGGVIVGGYVLTNDNDEKEPTKEEGKEDTEKIEEIQIGENYKVELFDENHSYYVDDISLKSEDDIKNFVAIADRFSNKTLRENFLDNKYNLTEFKLAYIIDIYGGNEIGGIYYFDIEFLKEQMEKVFHPVEYYSFGSSSATLNASYVTNICDDSICMISKVVGGGAGDSHYVTNIVSSRKDGENTIYTLKEYYIEFQGDVLVASEGESLCKSDSCPEDIVGTYGDKLNTYEMTFDKDNRYVSSKKIN